MGVIIQDFGAGGGRRWDLQNILQGGNSDDPVVWIGDLGDDPRDQVEPQRIPPQGGPPFGGN